MTPATPVTSGAPAPAGIRQYYDERVDGKLRDFDWANPRIEAAVRTLAAWAPQSPRRVLEIGCGIGATSWRIARAWPRATVVGLDISPASIEVANTCFRLPNLTYVAGPLEPNRFDPGFDLVVLMDVYEHIAPADRPSLHQVFKTLLASESRVVMTLPTSATQDYARVHTPADLQPVDENIDLDLIITFARETATELLSYRQVGIWHYGDYAHVVLGRFQNLAPVPQPQPRPRVRRIADRLRSLLGSVDPASNTSGYLGTQDSMSNPALRRLQVSRPERRRLISAWPPTGRGRQA